MNNPYNQPYVLQLIQRITQAMAHKDTTTQEHTTMIPTNKATPSLTEQGTIPMANVDMGTIIATLWLQIAALL